jgi:hypothetical protein
MHSCTSTGSGITPSFTSSLASHRWPVSKASISIRTPAAVIRRAMSRSMPGVLTIT